MKSIVPCLALMIIAGAAVSQVPKRISYQGLLTTASGTPAANGSYDLQFALRDSSTGGTMLWTETHGAVTVQSGTFSVILGSITGFNLPFSKRYFVEVTATAGPGIGSPITFSPRSELTSSPYSLRADTAEYAKASPGGGGGPFLALAGGMMTGAIASTGDPTISMGKGNFGTGNVNDGTQAFVAGSNNRARGNYSTIAGGGGATAADSNSVQGEYSTVGGGRKNIANGTHNTVAGGQSNAATGVFQATVGGGGFNTASGNVATVSGGSSNTASGYRSSVGGGVSNTASSLSATVGGGESNTASGSYSTIGGGFNNKSRGSYTVVNGGGGVFASDSNSAIGNWSAIGGGTRNVALGDSSVVNGGSGNIASGISTAIGGGGNNRARGLYAVVGGGGGPAVGDSNSASGPYSIVGGGVRNKATAFVSTVGGGFANTASLDGAVVAGGSGNAASGIASTVGGGELNLASGKDATIPGGKDNNAAGAYSLAAGWKANASHTGTFVWADSTGALGTDFTSSGPNQFLIRASGGVGMGTSTPTAQLAVSGAENNGSNATMKVITGFNILFLDGDEIDSNGDLYLLNNSSLNLILANGGGKVGVATTTPSSTFHLAGSFASTVTSVTSTLDLNETHNVILCSPSAPGISINLPSATGCPGRRYIIKKIDASGNNVTIDPSGLQLIDGATLYFLTSQYQYIEIVAKLFSMVDHW